MRTVLALVAILAAIGIGPTVVRSATAPEPIWLVQISFPAIAKHPETDSDAYPGRVEIYQDERFVGCAWASTYEPAPGQRRLTPMNLGYTATGAKDTIHVEAFGELERLGGMTVRISELSAASK